MNLLRLTKENMGYSYHVAVVIMQLAAHKEANLDSWSYIQ